MTFKIKVRILIVEDNKDKYEKIREQFDAYNSSSEHATLNYDWARSSFRAIEKFNREYYDVVILDLNIPQNDPDPNDLEGAECSVENAKSLYKYITKKTFNRPLLIFGLTVMENKDYEKQFASTPIFSVEKYNSDNWFTNITDRIEIIVGGKSALTEFVNNNYNYDIIILVARYHNEYLPIRDAINFLNESRKHPVLDPVRESAFGEIEVSGKILRLGLICLGEMGLPITASYTSQLVQYFRPRYFTMLGMCCGFKDDRMSKKTKLGDVVIARQTVNWDEGKYSDEKVEELGEPFYHNRQIIKSPTNSFVAEIGQLLEAHSESIETELSEFYKQDKNKENIAKLDDYTFDFDPDVYFDTMMSGSSVINSVEKIADIRDRFEPAISLEMEAHAVYTAVDCMFGKKPKVSVIKGVADHGDGKKAKVIQPMMSVASYHVFLKLITVME